MSLGCGRANIAMSSNLLVAGALGDKTQDFFFAWAKTIELLSISLVRPPNSSGSLNAIKGETIA